MWIFYVIVRNVVDIRDLVLSWHYNTKVLTLNKCIEHTNLALKYFDKVIITRVYLATLNLSPITYDTVLLYLDQLTPVIVQIPYTGKW